MQPKTHRLISVLLLAVLLLTLAAPALAQEGTTPMAPLAVEPLSQTTGGTCSPLSKEQQAAFERLAQLKEAGQLDSAGYDLFLKLGQQAGCGATAAAPEGGEAVSGYTFSQTPGSYTEITGGTLHGSGTTVDDNNYNAVNIGFTFTYDGANYTQVGINANGFVRMGGTAFTTSCLYTPISSTDTTNCKNLVSALGMDLQGNALGELRSQTTGTAPNQVFTVQWKDFRYYSATSEGFNFQIKLYETSNKVEVVYGVFTKNATSRSPQVGIKGATNADYSNRTGSNWAASTAGGSNAATMTLSTTALPASGQTYTWTPPSGPPGCAINPSPADAATGVSISTTLAWSAGSGGAPTSYDVYFGTAGTPPFVANVASSPYSPGALIYSTTYYWQIVPKNASGPATGCPIWSFTTMADPTITPPWLEPFATYPPTNWTEATGLLAAPTTLSGTSSGWTHDAFGNVGATNNSAKLNIYGTSVKEWAFTPPINLGTGMGYQLEFDLALTVWNATTSSALGADDKFAVVISTDGGATWTSANTLQQWTSATPISNTGDHIVIDLSAYSGIVKFGFYGESTVSNADNDLFVDNVQVRQPPAGPPNCAINPAPADAATNVSINTNLAWAAGAGGGIPTSYDVYFGTAVTPPFVANVAASPYNPGALAYSTTYYWQIVPKNANGPATGCPVWSFTTEADPTVTVFPYSQDFNGASFPGWTVENTNGDTYVWGAQTTYRRGTSGAAAAIRWNTSLAMDDWLFTPPLQLTGGVTYGVRFFYRAAGATFPEKMEVKWGSANSSAAMTNGPIFDNPNITNTVMKEAIAIFTPGSNGVYHVGFHGYSAADMFYLVVDDVTVYDTADSTWQWQGGTSNDWFVNANWEGSIVPGELDEVKIPVVVRAPNASSPVIGSSSETSYGPVNNLTVDPGATLEVGAVNNLKVLGAVTNNGTLQQTLPVALGSPVVFLNITDGATPTAANKYFGVEINATSISLDSTTVTVSGNQKCAGVGNSTVKRCYTIAPTTQAAADIKFYFSEPEMTPTGQPLASQNVWNYHTSVWNAVTRGTDSGTCASGAINCFVQGTGIATYSPFAVGPSQPLAVTLASFTAQGLSDRVLVDWVTLSEYDNAGFNLYRSSDPSGPLTLLAYVPSQSPGSTQGFAYRVEDLAVQPGETWWYTLEDVALNGATTLHGPVSATVQAPTAVTLGSLDASPAAAGSALPWLLLAAGAGLALGARRMRRRA